MQASAEPRGDCRARRGSRAIVRDDRGGGATPLWRRRHTFVRAAAGAPDEPWNHRLAWRLEKHAKPFGKEDMMNRTVLLLGIVLADFLGLSAWALYHHGYVGLFEAAVATPAGIQVLVDLTIALSLFTVWMWRDARERGIAVWPFVLLTATLGSIGALAYLLRRELGREAAIAPRPVPATVR
jgi:hypothetical protein